MKGRISSLLNPYLELFHLYYAKNLKEMERRNKKFKNTLNDLYCASVDWKYYYV